jgi:murein DD-endopeptidase MepM/ murein hydrolase activator NlpD
VEILSDEYPAQVDVSKRYRLIAASDDYRPDQIVIGWVKSIDLLDNCNGPANQLACYPIDIHKVYKVYGFGPTYEAYKLRNSSYKSLRGLHNGLDFSAPIGTPLIWGGTGVGHWTEHSYDASPAFGIMYAGRKFVYGHRLADYTTDKMSSEVRPGQTIGASGPPSGYEDSPHLHFGVRGRGSENTYFTHFNPLYYFATPLRSSITTKIGNGYANLPYGEVYNSYSMISFRSDNPYSGYEFWVNPCDRIWDGIEMAYQKSTFPYIEY